ncbi:hypothetical protein C0584_03645 [Candidatus Parcubacteria bacterium]|nr:MAG: hypothetical protein C0584_03645 [Candidatus Parcubacteria bacterium]
MKKFQIGVMGSAADLKYSKKIENIAKKLGEEIAKNDCILVYGAEKDSSSLSTVAAKAAKRMNGFTVGVTYGKGMDIWERNYADVIIASGMERGGGRELALVNSCDGIIAISGGSGTLTEILIAYQLNIPIVVIKGTGGWADQVADKFLDSRKRLKVIGVSEYSGAVKRMIREIKKKTNEK